MRIALSFMLILGVISLKSLNFLAFDGFLTVPKKIWNFGIHRNILILLICLFHFSLSFCFGLYVFLVLFFCGFFCGHWCLIRWLLISGEETFCLTRFFWFTCFGWNKEQNYLSVGTGQITWVRYRRTLTIRRSLVYEIFSSISFFLSFFLFLI